MLNPQRFLKCKLSNRDLVRTGATGASAPAEIRQRVRHTRPKDSDGLRAKNPNFYELCVHQIHVNWNLFTDIALGHINL